MTTLHIEPPVTDFSTWKQAFDGFAALRRSARVRGHVVRRPVDDPCYVLIDLDFDTTQDAAAFLEVLRRRIWALPANSPALAGEPITRLLTTVDAGSSAPRTT